MFDKTIRPSVLACALALTPVASTSGEVNTGYFGNVAIKGYDPVAYFTMSKPVAGREGITQQWLGAEWRFANEDHRDLFRNDPVAYAPQYGGHCADALAYDTMTTNIDPTAWRIIEGKLYLNYDQGAAVEIEEISGQIDRADAYWDKILPELTAN